MSNDEVSFQWHVGIGGIGGALILFSSREIIHSVKLRAVTFEIPTVYMIIRALRSLSLAI